MNEMSNINGNNKINSLSKQNFNGVSMMQSNTASTQPTTPVYNTVPTQPTTPVYNTVPTQPTAPVYNTASTQSTTPVYNTASTQPTNVGNIAYIDPTRVSVSQTAGVQGGIQSSEAINPMSAVANLNKEEAMEEALSHTNQYTPFEAPKQEVNKEVKKANNKSTYIFIVLILAIMLLFIIFLPQISNLFGWV